MAEMTRPDGSRPADTDVGDRSRIGGVGTTPGFLSLVPTEVGPETEVVQLPEKVASVDKRAVVTGRVRVATRTEAVSEIVRDTLEEQTVDVERIPPDHGLAAGEAAPQVRTEGDVTVILVLEKVLVVEKRLRLKEELRVVHRAT